jgi:lipopolysaccharide heptosyltransferase III
MVSICIRCLIVIMFLKKNNINPKDTHNILLIQLGDIGDVVLSLPCIRALRENFRQADVIVAVREKAKELIEDCSWATGVIAIDKNRRSFIQEIIYQKKFILILRKYNFDLVIDLRTGTRGAILAMLSGARQRVGFYSQDGKLWRNRLFTHLYSPEIKPKDYVADRYLSLLIAHNIKTDNCRPEIDIPNEKLQKVAALFKKENIPLDHPVIAIQPFSLWKYKEWGMEKYAVLVRRICSEYGFPVIITGSLEEREKAHEIKKTGGPNVYNFAGKTSIGMFSAILKSCKLFIGGDSAGIHVAAAVGTPTVSIFGPASLFAWAPRGKQHAIVYNETLSCVPCDLKGCEGRGISRCLDELTVDDVMSVVKGQIDKIING